MDFDTDPRLEALKAQSFTWTRRTVYDITENKPIPRGARVEIVDVVTCDDIVYVEHDDRIYAATADELVIP